MGIHLNGNPVAVLVGDCCARLAELEDESVHCCVTSPPYWGLRDYSSEGQLGLEKTPEEYVEKMVAVFREVRRVLRADATLWLNLGSSYASDPRKGGSGTPNGRNNRGEAYGRPGCGRADGLVKEDSLRNRDGAPVPPGFKPKDLVPIPWMVAMALQADGWYLRSDIIWAKPNPMPESVTDRPTKAHEYLFLLSKSASYYYDAEAIKERIETEPHSPGNRKLDGNGFSSGGNITDKDSICGSNGTKNKRSVWTVATAPYPEAHFATYPPDLIKPCIMAGTSARGCCARCGAPWERVVEHRDVDQAANEVIETDGVPGLRPGTSHDRVRKLSGSTYQYVRGETLGWEPTCACCDPARSSTAYSTAIFPGPCTVLDPFAGSGTTGAVALELGRRAVLIELNPVYAELIEQRTSTTMGLALA